MTDKAMVVNTRNWPAWPLLPMIGKVKDNGKTGIIIANRMLRVYDLNLFSFSSGPLAEILEGAEYQDYESVDALLNEWRVD